MPIVRQDILSEVLNIEGRIAGELDGERQRVAQWLERTRREIEAETLGEINLLKAAAAREDESAQKVAGEKAAAILQSTQTAAERIRGLEDARLRPLLRQHLAIILRGPAR